MTQPQPNYIFQEKFKHESISSEFAAKLIYTEYVKNSNPKSFCHETLGMNFKKDFSDILRLERIFIINHKYYVISSNITEENDLIAILNSYLQCKNTEVQKSAKRFLITWDFFNRSPIEKIMIKKNVYSKKTKESETKCKLMYPIEEYVNLFKSDTFLTNLEAACYVSKNIYYEMSNK